MNFTREPIIETVVTPREGCKLVVRSSKGNGQEDYLVDAVEVVSFGHSLFFRSLEKPKSFLVPVSDYEVLELRETRMVLKHVPSERSVKISGGKDQPPRQSREHSRESLPEPRHQEKEAAPAASDDEVLDPQAAPTGEATPADPKVADRKRERRRRGRRGRSERAPDGTAAATPVDGEAADQNSSDEQDFADGIVIENKPDLSPEGTEEGKPVKAPSLLSRLFLAPPPPLIRRHIQLPKPPELPQDSMQELSETQSEESKREVIKPTEGQATPSLEDKPFTEQLNEESNPED